MPGKLTVLRKYISQASKGLSSLSHVTSTEVSLTDVNLKPSGCGRTTAQQKKKTVTTDNVGQVANNPQDDFDIRVATLALTGTLLLLLKTA